MFHKKALATLTITITLFGCGGRHHVDRQASVNDALSLPVFGRTATFDRNDAETDALMTHFIDSGVLDYTSTSCGRELRTPDLELMESIGVAPRVFHL